jgi:hypothetical protein
MWAGPIFKVSTWVFPQWGSILNLRTDRSLTIGGSSDSPHWGKSQTPGIGGSVRSPMGAGSKYRNFRHLRCEQTCAHLPPGDFLNLRKMCPVLDGSPRCPGLDRSFFQNWKQLQNSRAASPALQGKGAALKNHRGGERTSDEYRRMTKGKFPLGNFVRDRTKLCSPQI